MDRNKLVLITGMSGAGKTSAMAVFENMEFICMDNYPVMLLTEFMELIKVDAKYQNVAMAISLEEAMRAIQIVKNVDWVDFSVVFLDCSDEILLRRYKETRRTHPALISNKAATILEGIEYERNLSASIQNYANVKIDTTNLKFSKTQELIENHFKLNKFDPFRISFVSFGYKFGAPKDADLLLDVRFLPNPFYEVELREKTGNDKEVFDFVVEKEETKVFIEKTIKYLDYLFEQYEKEGRMHLIVGIGCTGGQHRSVTLTNYFADYYDKIYQVHRLHRDAHH